MLYVGRFVSLKESSHCDETPLAPCARVLIPIQLMEKIRCKDAHARCAWTGAIRTSKINVKNNVKMTLGITSAQHVDLYKTVDSSKFRPSVLHPT